MPLKSDFLTGILAHVPEAERGKAEAQLEELEKGSLKQADYSRLANEATEAKRKFDELYTKNTDWYTQRQKDLQELDALRTKVTALEAGNGDGNTPRNDPPKLPEGLITKKEVQELFDVTERGAVGFIAETNALTMRHFKEFGEILNVNELLADPQVQKIGLQGVYQQKFKDQIKQKADAAQALRDEALRKEGADKLRAELAASRGPGYPVVGNEPSSLDAIEAATRSGDGKIAVKSLDDMAAEYARLGASRVGAS